MRSRAAPETMVWGEAGWIAGIFVSFLLADATDSKTRALIKIFF
jgi:hypothetical protein